MNFQLSKKLLLDRRVPLWTKGLSIGIGFAVFGFVTLLELPFEAFLAAALPFLGIAGDVALEGVEGIAIPLVVAWVLLPYISPKEVVEVIRREMSSMPPEKPVVEVPVEKVR